MLLALDIGNTNITVGVFLGEDLKATWRIATLANGLRLVVTPMPQSQAASLAIYVGVGSRQERARETHVARITFVLRDQVPNALIPINPLGLTITYFRVDQAFQ